MLWVFRFFYILYNFRVNYWFVKAMYFIRKYLLFLKYLCYWAYGFVNPVSRVFVLLRLHCAVRITSEKVSIVRIYSSTKIVDLTIIYLWSNRFLKYLITKSLQVPTSKIKKKSTIKQKHWKYDVNVLIWLVCDIKLLSWHKNCKCDVMNTIRTLLFQRHLKECYSKN